MTGYGQRKVSCKRGRNPSRRGSREDDRMQRLQYRGVTLWRGADVRGASLARIRRLEGKQHTRRGIVRGCVPGV